MKSEKITAGGSYLAIGSGKTKGAFNAAKALGLTPVLIPVHGGADIASFVASVANVFNQDPKALVIIDLFPSRVSASLCNVLAEAAQEGTVMTPDGIIDVSQGTFILETDEPELVDPSILCRFKPVNFSVAKPD